MAVVFFLFTLFIGMTSAQYCSNIHGCTPYELKAELSDRDEDNLYQVLSWDVKDEKVSVICDLVRTLDEITVSLNKLRFLKAFVFLDLIFRNLQPGNLKLSLD